MTATPVLPRTPPDHAPAETARRALPRWTSLAWQPLLVIVACLALFAWLHSLSLDSIEQQVLNQQAIVSAVGQQIEMSVTATALIIAIAVPAGILLSQRRARPAMPFILGLGNIGQAFPAVGVLILASIIYGIGFWVAVASFTAYGILPTLRNTLTGLRQIDQATVDAARGMGMTSWQRLWKIELPLSLPVILAGVRTTLILTVGVATLGTFVNAGGLGDIIVTGLKLNRTPVIITGAVLTAAVAFAVDWIARVAEEIFRPRGI